MAETTQKEVYFSCLSGYNLYTPVFDQPSTMVHLLSDTHVTVRSISNIGMDHVENKWRYFIENPINIQRITWPVDILELENGRMGLVFRKRGFSKMEPLKTILYQSILLDWHTDRIKGLITNLLEVIREIHRGGYAYHAFDMEHIYYNPQNNEILVDFSIGMSQRGKTPADLAEVDPKEIAVEFIPPWVPFNERRAFSHTDDYYSLAAMLFRMMVGRMPYQGRGMDGMGDMMDALRDTDWDEHQWMFSRYFKNPIFIFDPMDTSNNLGSVSSEGVFIERWNTLPDKIRAMFTDVFSKKNIELPYGEKILYSADEWIDALKSEGII